MALELIKREKRKKSKLIFYPLVVGCRMGHKTLPYPIINVIKLRGDGKT